jgi:3-dehydroquinate synthase
LIDPGLAARLEHLVQRAGLPIQGPALGASRYLELMGHDKKSLEGRIRYVLLKRLGEAVVQGADAALVANVIERRCKA